MPSIWNFYGQGNGDRLIDPTNYPPDVASFLLEEERLLERLVESFSILVEVGCMTGRFLDWAIERDKKYIGIDVVERYIQAGNDEILSRKLSQDLYQFRLGSAEDLSSVLKDKLQKADADKLLLFFPFNSIGNMPAVESVIQSLKQCNLRFVISTYLTDEKSNASRADYYNRCKYLNVQLVQNAQGVCFKSDDGLQSIAYHPLYFRQLCLANSLAIASISFSEIGIAYLLTSEKI
ncbi:MAG: methyltransferase domain-containing protein [Patescibacteria group bacterium]|jgi:hypothetical protein